MSRRELVIVTCLSVVVIVCAGCLVGCSQETSDQSNEIFADTVGNGIRLNEGLRLAPGNSKFYMPYGSVDIFVINHTGYNLAFEDKAFGVQGFVFNEEQAQWEEIDLGLTSAPGPRCLQDGATDLSETWASFPTKWIDTEGHNEVRLLVVGYTADLAESTPVARKYGAYADIKIVEGSTIVPTPTAIIITPLLTVTSPEP